MISVFLLRANNIQKSLLHLQVCLTMCDNSVLIREKTGQRKPIFWHIIRRKDFIVFIFAYRSNVCIQAITIMYYMHSLFLYLFLSDKKYLQWNSKVMSYGFSLVSFLQHSKVKIDAFFKLVWLVWLLVLTSFFFFFFFFLKLMIMPEGSLVTNKSWKQQF